MTLFQSLPHAPEIYAMSFAAALILGAWELSNGRRGGAVLAILAAATHLVGPAAPPRVFAVSLMLPVLFEERRSSSEEKDLVRGCLAAMILSCNAAVLVI